MSNHGTVECKECNGTGSISNPVLYDGIGGAEYVDCGHCNGKGTLENWGIKIQCPDCGSIFIIDEYGEYYCPKCKRNYLEPEIRMRCGI